MTLERPKNPKHMILTSFITPGGRHPGAWKLPDSRAEDLGVNFDFVRELVQLAEDAKLDSIFFGDRNEGDFIRRQDLQPSGPHEPVTTMSALAVTTKKIGIAGTISTTYSNPYQTARHLTGIDHLSRGRVGWNIVTSSEGVENFSYTEETFPPNTVRYAMADEFLQACIGLWDSWTDDAVIVDREKGVWAVPERIRDVNFAGEYYQVKGPFNMRRSPQGRPVLFQAGQSEAGMAFGIKYADAIYAVQNEMHASIEYMKRYEQMLTAIGRDPKSLKVLPGIMPIMGDNQKDADEFAAYLASVNDFEEVKQRIMRGVKVDLSGIELDEKIPLERWDAPDVPRHAHGGNVRRMAIEQNGTLREFLSLASRGIGGHLNAVGTASSIADVMVEWFEAGACSGFNFNIPANTMRAQLPVYKELVPELQSRGYFREEYEGDTLRDHLGLSRPAA